MIHHERSEVCYLRADQLKDGHYALSQSGFLCLKLSFASFPNLSDHERMVNIENGVGSFHAGSLFRVLSDEEVSFKTNGLGKVKE